MPNAEGRMEVTQEQLDDAEYAVRQSMAADDRQTPRERDDGLLGLRLILDALAARTREVAAMRADAERWRYVQREAKVWVEEFLWVVAGYRDGEDTLTETVDRALAAQEGTR